MEVVDQPDGVKAGKVEDDISFMLTNNMGSFCLMSHFSKSRFEGVFFREGSRLYKTICLFSHNSPVKKLTNCLWAVNRERESVTESFFMPMKSNSLVYEMDSTAEFDLILDCKQIYDNREWGRNYEISREQGCLLIKFTKKSDSRDDNSRFNEEFSIYIAAYSGSLEFKEVNRWEKHFYEYDKERDSTPFERHVFNACRIRCNGAAFAFSTDKRKAIIEAKYVWRNRDSLKRDKEKHVSRLIHKKQITDNEVAVAYQCSLNAVDSLRVNDEGIVAGLPWFFQFWARDELISLKAFINMGEYEFCRKILFKYLDMITPEGKLPEKDIESGVESADAVLWLFKRFEDYIDALEKKGLAKKYISGRDIWRVNEKLAAVITHWMKNYDEGGLLVNGPQETWMDTSYANDSRQGARIEINALFLACLRLMRRLSKEDVFEKHLVKRIRESFFDGKALKDRADDPTIRPNAFIAAYVYPELLDRKEWIKCFDSMLPKLWLGWGGLASIDKSSKLYTSYYTGENPKSYHRGDSWFWLNNIAAIVLFRLDRERFKGYISKIIKADVEEMLYKGVTGYPSELSSASELKAQGCMCQAWSAATFIELIDEVYG